MCIILNIFKHLFNIFTSYNKSYYHEIYCMSKKLEGSEKEDPREEFREKFKKKFQERIANGEVFDFT